MVGLKGWERGFEIYLGGLWGEEGGGKEEKEKEKECLLCNARKPADKSLYSSWKKKICTQWWLCVFFVFFF